MGVQGWSGAVSPLEMGLEEGVAETPSCCLCWTCVWASENKSQGAENPIPAPSRTPKNLLADGKHGGDLGDGLAVLDEDLSNAWWYQPGHAHPWDNFTGVGASYWGSDWAEKVRTKQVLLPLCPG